MASRRLGFVLVGVVAVTVGCSANGCKKTTLVIEMTGGFAYIAQPSAKRLDVAYLNDVRLEEDIDTSKPGKEVVCEVHQVGTELKLLRGTIVSSTPAAPGSREFNLDQSEITFPALETANNINLSYSRKGWTATNPNAPTPSTPGDPHDAKDWENLQFIPAIKPRHAASTLNPNWPTMVNGRLRLKGGKVIGFLPSDWDMKEAQFDFKVNNASQFTSSYTDKLIYTVDVPGTQIEMRIDGPTDYTIIIEPTEQGKPVRLALKGLHSHGTPPDLAQDVELKDHCAFYSLLKDVPAYSTWLKPHYIASSALPSPGGGRPSPGFFCGGDWF